MNDAPVIFEERTYTVTPFEVATSGLSSILVAARKGLNLEHPFVVENDDGALVVRFRQHEIVRV